MSSAQESTASLRLDVEARVASVGATELDLTGQEFDLLVALTARPVVSREDLRRAINLRGESARRVDGIQAKEAKEEQREEKTQPEGRGASVESFR